MKASDLFVRCLEAEGVERIFGLPGEENADLMMSLMDSSIDFVLCHHEQAAAFMADGYGRMTGKAGVCLSTLGPGATNLVTGLADANMDRSPVVAITGQAATRRQHKESHQNMDVIDMVQPISKWAQSSACRRDPGGGAQGVQDRRRGKARRRHDRAARGHRGGSQRRADHAPADAASGADYKAVARAVEAIMAAKNPIILSGNGAVEGAPSNSAVWRKRSALASSTPSWARARSR